MQKACFAREVTISLVVFECVAGNTQRLDGFVRVGWHYRKARKHREGHLE